MKVLKKYGIESGADLVDALILFILGFSFLAYSVFYKSFAEIHFLSFLNSPVFIGEIILFICSTLVILKYLLFNQKYILNWKWSLILALYLLFVLVKAFAGYRQFGPFAFRHAAMFYYPLFALIAYEAYQEKFFNVNLLMAVLILILILFGIVTYYNFTYLILIFLCIVKSHSKKIKILGLAGILMFFPFKSLIYCARTQFVGHLVGFAVLGWLSLLIFKIKRSYKIGLIVLCLIFLSLVFMKLKDYGRFQSLINLKGMFKAISQWDDLIEKRRAGYERIEIPVKLYNPDKESLPMFRVIKLAKKMTHRSQQQQEGVVSNLSDSPLMVKELPVNNDNKQKDNLLDTFKSKEVFNGPFYVSADSVGVYSASASSVGVPLSEDAAPVKPNKIISTAGKTKSFSEPQPPDLDLRYNTAIFRLFVWRDMIKDLVRGRMFLGFHFGKPLRSETIELSDMAKTEWLRDGWVASHNSYMEIIYRSGIVGIALIFVIFTLFFEMMMSFVRKKSFTGICLLSIIAYWLTTTLFYVTLEMPYTAISFWSLFGITLAYCRKTLKISH